MPFFTLYISMLKVSTVLGSLFMSKPDIAHCEFHIVQELNVISPSANVGNFWCDSRSNYVVVMWRKIRIRMSDDDYDGSCESFFMHWLRIWKVFECAPINFCFIAKKKNIFDVLGAEEYPKLNISKNSKQIWASKSSTESSSLHIIFLRNLFWKILFSANGYVKFW